MAKWRQVIQDTDMGSYYGIYVTGEMMAIDKGIAPDSFCFFPMTTPGLLTHRYSEPGRDFNYEGCKENNIKIVKSPGTAGGCIYADPGRSVAAFIAWDINKHPEIPTDPEKLIARFLSRLADEMTIRYKIPFRYRPLNDYEVWDYRSQRFRKVQPTGTTILGKGAFLGWVINIFKPTELAIKALASPAEKFVDKEVKDSLLRGGYLEDISFFADRPVAPSYEDACEEIKDVWLKVLKDIFGIEVGKPESWTADEMKIFEELDKSGTAEENVLARSPDIAFKEISTGTALGYDFVKVPGGPLIRAYVLRKGDIIEKIIHTATIHMHPPTAFEEIEKELKGCKIDKKSISAKVDEVWKRLNVVLGMGSSALVADVIMKAGKASYENPIRTG